jgi:hypothetical protein
MGRRSTCGRDCGRWGRQSASQEISSTSWKSEVNYLDQADMYKRFLFVNLSLCRKKSADHSWPETFDAKYQPQI